MSQCADRIPSCVVAMKRSYSRSDQDLVQSMSSVIASHVTQSTVRSSILLGMLVSGKYATTSKQVGMQVHKC